MVHRVLIDAANLPIPKRLRNRQRSSKDSSQQLVPGTLIDRIHTSIDWQRQIDHGIKKSQIALEVGFTTKRVSELMWLAKLPSNIIQKIKTGHQDYKEWSISQAIKEARRLHKRNEVHKTLKLVSRWRKLLENGMKKSEIARREGLTKARITQLMKLAELPPDRLAQIQSWETPVTLRELIDSTSPS